MFPQNNISRIRWYLYRHGFSIEKLVARFNNTTNVNKFLITSIPKSGTNLVERVFGLSKYYRRKLIRTLNQENLSNKFNFSRIIDNIRLGEYVVSHLHFSMYYLQEIQSKSVKTIFMIRDPRDLAISFTHYIYKTKKHPYYEYYSRIEDFNERLLLTIKGDEENNIYGLGYHLENFIGWLNHADYIIKFEDFFNKNNELNIEYIENLIENFSIPDNKFLAKLKKQLVSKSSPTYRLAKKGNWREYFDDSTLKYFNTKFAPYLIKYGYDE